MEFSAWIENELEKRNWSQRELVRRSKNSGYKISPGQLSHIISGSRQAGPDACIAIAIALGVSREEIFRARGWLLGTDDKDNEMDPQVEYLAQGVNALPNESRQLALSAMKPMLDSIRQLTQIRESQAEYTSA